jgi:hypothetical protein
VDLACVEKIGKIESIVFFVYDYKKGVFLKNDTFSLKYEDSTIINIQTLDLNKDNNFDLIITYIKGSLYETDVLLYNIGKQNFEKFKIQNLSDDKELSSIVVNDINGDGM